MHGSIGVSSTSSLTDDTGAQTIKLELNFKETQIKIRREVVEVTEDHMC